MANQAASAVDLTAVRSPDKSPACSSRQLAAHRREARVEWSSLVGLTTAAHGGPSVVARALGLNGPDRVEDLGNPEHDAALTFGDALAASRKGARSWAVSLAIAFLAKVKEETPIVDIHPLRLCARLSASLGELLGGVDEALADEDVSPDEARRLLRDIADHEARLIALKGWLERRARAR